jgi:hypothetical protein
MEKGELLCVGITKPAAVIRWYGDGLTVGLGKENVCVSPLGAPIQ